MRRFWSYRLPALIGIVLAAAGVLGYLLLVSFGRPDPAQVLLFWMLYGLAHWPPVEIKVSGIASPSAGHVRPPSLSAGFLVLMTAAFATSPPTAFLVGLLSPFAPANRRGAARTLYNSGQGAIYTASASAVFAVLSSPGSSLPQLLLGAGAAAFLAVCLNTLLVSFAISTERGWGLLRAIRPLIWPARHSMVFAVFALLIADIYRGAGFLAVFFLLAPLVILRNVRRVKQEYEVSRDRTLRMFVRAVELKDPYTCTHSERVALIVCELHRRLGAGAHDIDIRNLGALMHDIGKIAVPLSVLSKQGPLTPDEFEIVKAHPVMGSELASEVDMLRCVGGEIRHHHERIDGRGYPDGLSGDQIPWAARVMAVADTFEALTSHRPYRSALSDTEALAEIERVAGAQLDPDVVQTLVQAVSEGFALPPSAHRPRAHGRVTGGAGLMGRA